MYAAIPLFIAVLRLAFRPEGKLNFEHLLHRVREYPQLHSKCSLCSSRTRFPSGPTVLLTKVKVRYNYKRVRGLVQFKPRTPCIDADLYMLKHGRVRVCAALFSDLRTHRRIHSLLREQPTCNASTFLTCTRVPKFYWYHPHLSQNSRTRFYFICTWIRKER